MQSVNRIIIVLVVVFFTVNSSVSQNLSKVKLHSIQSDLMLYNDVEGIIFTSQTLQANFKLKNSYFGVGYVFSYEYIGTSNSYGSFVFDSNILTRSGGLLCYGYRTPLAKGKWYGMLQTQFFASHHAAVNHSTDLYSKLHSHVRVMNFLQFALGYGVGIELGKHIDLQTSIQLGFTHVSETHYPIYTTWRVRHYSDFVGTKCTKLSLIYKL